ncbi:MAG: hypothetical protein NXI27_23755 [Alphaproteobacteria bacterium]|nr:hypothetical protein [Alphaproteobacteria bacterium]
MAEIIHLHKQARGRKPRERSFEAVAGEAKILLFTGVRYERAAPGTPVTKRGGKRITSR